MLVNLLYKYSAIILLQTIDISIRLIHSSNFTIISYLNGELGTQLWDYLKIIYMMMYITCEASEMLSQAVLESITFSFRISLDIIHRHWGRIMKRMVLSH